MSVQYQVVWCLLVCEIAIFSVLLLPWPPRWRRRLHAFFLDSGLVRRAWYAVRILLILVALLFLDSTHRAIKASNQRGLWHETATLNLHPYSGRDLVAREESQLNVRMFYSQRNMYLTGFTLFLALLIGRIAQLMHANLELGDKNARIVQEIAELRREMHLAQTLYKRPDENELSELRKKALDVEAMQRQAANLQIEYARLTDYVAELEEKLALESNEPKKTK